MSPSGAIPQFDLSLLPISNLSKIGQYSPRYPQEYAMRTHRFGRKLKLPSTIAIKQHQIRRLMFEESVKKAAARASAEAIRALPREEARPLVESG